MERAFSWRRWRTPPIDPKTVRVPNRLSSVPVICPLMTLYPIEMLLSSGKRKNPIRFLSQSRPRKFRGIRNLRKNPGTVRSPTPSMELSGRSQNKESDSSFMRRTFLRMRLSLSGNSPRQWWMHSKIYPGNRLYCANGNERFLIQAYPEQTSGYKQNAINFHCRFDESP